MIRNFPRICLLGAFVVGSSSLSAMPFDEARHLLSRTGFGGTSEEIVSLMGRSYVDGVDHILNRTRLRSSVPAPGWTDNPLPNLRKFRKLPAQEKREIRMKIVKQAVELKSWWYQEMLNTESPLTERMTLFWHNHFTSGIHKVKWPAFLYRQNALLRKYSTGNFKSLLHAIARDPAMMIYLDNQTNRKGRPNENFARELLELFTLGEGKYSESDIKEAARAFTGWHINPGNGQFRIFRRRHDDGQKTFLGHTGNFDGDDIIDILLQQPQVATLITTKLWRELVSQKIEPAEIDRLATLFRKSDYEIKPLLRAMLLSPEFRNKNNRGTLVKSPVELIVGTLHLLKIPAQNSERLPIAGRYLGQDLFEPPNVKGWKGGNAWITTTTLLARQDLISRFTRGKEMRKRSLPAIRPAASGDKKSLPMNSKTRNILTMTMLPLKPWNRLPQDLNLREGILELIQDPVYQLK